MMRVTNVWRRWQGMTAMQRVALIRATMAFPWMWRQLNRQGLKPLHGRIRLRCERSDKPGLPHAQVRQLADAVNLAAAHSPFRVTCLTRSLVLMDILAGYGTTAALTVGVRVRDQRLDAHAWVVHDGMPVNDRADIGESYAPFEDWDLDMIFGSP